MRQALRLGAVQSFADCGHNFTDIEQAIEDIRQTFLDMQRLIPASGIKILVEETDGRAHPYTLAAGAGVTITVNGTTRTITVKAP